MKGRIHSIETCGTVDGPGIRFVIFMQGCLLRCRYCHNPDTWDFQGGQEISVDELMNRIERYAPYMKFSGGGVTVSGGEPLLQLEFITHFFKECKKRGIHTALDTSAGCLTGNIEQIKGVDELLHYTDLVLLDIKLMDEDKHRQLTGVANQKILQFARTLSEKKVDVWIRHVLVPGITDDEKDLNDLARFIQSLSNVKKVEVLPYHQMGVYKWEALGLTYTLDHVVPPSDEEVLRVSKLLSSQISPT